jgi:hypothetical protein
LSIVFKADLKYPIGGLVEKLREAFEEWLQKNKVQLDADYFKEIFNRYKVIGVQLISSLIKGVQFREQGGAKKDSRRLDVIRDVIILKSSVLTCSSLF